MERGTGNSYREDYFSFPLQESLQENFAKNKLFGRILSTLQLGPFRELGWQVPAGTATSALGGLMPLSPTPHQGMPIFFFSSSDGTGEDVPHPPLLPLSPSFQPVSPVQQGSVGITAANLTCF